MLVTLKPINRYTGVKANGKKYMIDRGVRELLDNLNWDSDLKRCIVLNEKATYGHVVPLSIFLNIKTSKTLNIYKVALNNIEEFNTISNKIDIVWLVEEYPITEDDKDLYKLHNIIIDEIESTEFQEWRKETSIMILHLIKAARIEYGI